MSDWQRRPTKTMPHGFTAAVIGELVTAPEVLTKNPTEWPKIGAKLAVRHSEDQVSVVPVIAVGPVGDWLRKQKVGDVLYIGGHVKSATGHIEVFASEGKKATVRPPMSVLDQMFGGGGSPQGDDD